VNNKLELAQLSQFNACFYLNLSKVEYQIDQKRIELLGQMQEMAQKNSIVIFISDNQQWIKSVNPEGAVKQTLSTAGLSNIINNNDIYTVFNNVPRSAENLHRKQWFFLSADGADLHSDAK